MDTLKWLVPRLGIWLHTRQSVRGVVAFQYDQCHGYMSIDNIHAINLHLLSYVVVLTDTERVNPQISLAQFLGEGHGVPDDFR